MAQFKGIAVNFRFGSRGYPESATDIELLGDSILTILKTVPGERPYRPTFGCYVSLLLFASMSRAAALRARSETRRAIEKWEERVIVDDITIEMKDSRIALTVHWRPKSSPGQKTKTALEVLA